MIKPYFRRLLQAVTCYGIGSPETMRTPGKRMEARYDRGVPWHRGVPMPLVVIGDQLCVALCFIPISESVDPKKERKDPTTVVYKSAATVDIP